MLSLSKARYKCLKEFVHLAVGMVSSAIGAAAMYWNDTGAATPRFLFSRICITFEVNACYKNSTRAVDVMVAQIVLLKTSTCTCKVMKKGMKRVTGVE